MENLFLVVVVGGLIFTTWKVSKSFTKKTTPKVSSGGVPVESTKSITDNQI